MYGNQYQKNFEIIMMMCMNEAKLTEAVKDIQREVSTMRPSYIIKELEEE